ncbi:hypothetical protein ACLOJK_039575 [Asimina triloba]
MTSATAQKSLFRRTCQRTSVSRQAKSAVFVDISAVRSSRFLYTGRTPDGTRPPFLKRWQPKNRRPKWHSSMNPIRSISDLVMRVRQPMFQKAWKGRSLHLIRERRLQARLCQTQNAEEDFLHRCTRTIGHSDADIIGRHVVGVVVLEFPNRLRGSVGVGFTELMESPDSQSPTPISIPDTAASRNPFSVSTTLRRGILRKLKHGGGKSFQPIPIWARQREEKNEKMGSFEKDGGMTMKSNERCDSFVLEMESLLHVAHKDLNGSQKDINGSPRITVWAAVIIATMIDYDCVLLCPTEVAEKFVEERIRERRKGGCAPEAKARNTASCCYWYGI